MGLRHLSTRLRRAEAVALVSAMLGFAIAVPAAAGSTTCLERSPGGNWATYGQDLMGQQRQLAERYINRANVGGLARAWATGDTGYQSPPPIVHGGCVLLNERGRITARDLRTGRMVWESQGPDTSGSFAVTVVDGRVHVGLNNRGTPRAAAFDVRNGKLLWVSPEITFGYTTSQQSSAIVYDGVQALFTTGPDNDPKAKQGFALLDARTGKVLRKDLTIPAAERAKGQVGGGVWGTPTVDPKTGYLYVGTSNPESKQTEGAYDNAIIKMDVRRGRKTFGRIVATYKGTPDSITGYDNPVCQSVGGTLWFNAGIYGASPSCGQLDVDFGNGPTLWRNSNGRLMGAASQKSGVLHVFYGDTMKPAWSKQLFVSLGFGGGNIGRIATDGKTLYVSMNPGIIYAFDAETGAERWRQKVVNQAPMTGGNLALANGVVYYAEDSFARAFNSATGEVLWTGDLSQQPGSTIGNGVAVAGNHVVVNFFGKVIAYRLPGRDTRP